MLLAGEVGGERGDRGGNRAGTLQHTPEDHHVDVGRERGNHAADGKQQQAEDDHRLAPETVRRGAERNLQHGLGQPVGTERDADQGQVRTAWQGLGIDCEHRQDQEQPEHAQSEDRGQGRADPALARTHAVVGI